MMKYSLGFLINMYKATMMLYHRNQGRTLIVLKETIRLAGLCGLFICEYLWSFLPKTTLIEISLYIYNIIRRG